MAKRKRQRRPRPKPASESYSDSEGNVLVLRRELSPATIAKIDQRAARPGASLDDAWRRRTELLFEYLAVSWEIAELPITDQSMLLGRLRMADSATQTWVRETIAAHVERHIPELSGG